MSISQTIAGASRRRRSASALAGVALLALGACGGDDKGAEATKAPNRPASQSFADAAPLTWATRPPAVVRGNVVTLDLAVNGVAIVPADGDTSGTRGHLHVFVDRPALPPGAVIPKEAGIIHTTDTKVTVSGLAGGPHRFSVVLGDGLHRRLGDAILEADVKLEGPAVTVSAPATVPAGQPAVLDISVEGLRLVAADGDRSGHTGHLHLFVDRPPTPAGQAIPKEDGIIHTTETRVSVPNLAAGEHTVWVVVGDGLHEPLNPPVMAKATFVVQG